MNENKIPLRSEVPAEYKWDLTQLYKNDDEWESDLNRIPEATARLVSFRGRLGESAATFLEALRADEALDRLVEKVFHYASLNNEADQGDSQAQEKYNTVMMAYTRSASETSFYVPEIMAIDDEKISAWIQQDEFKDYRVYIQKMLHTKPAYLNQPISATSITAAPASHSRLRVLRICRAEYQDTSAMNISSRRYFGPAQL